MAQIGKKRYINTRFWEDSFIQGLNPLDRYLFLYFLTNPHTNIAGIYEVPLKIVSAETGIEVEMVKKMLRRLTGKIFYIRGWVYIKNFTKHQAVNDTMKLGVERILSEVPPYVLDKISLIREDRLPPDYPPTSDISKSKSKSKDIAEESADPKKPKKRLDWRGLEEELKVLESSLRRPIQIIALYIREKEFRPENRDQLDSLISRNVRAASLLKGYTNDDIQDTVKAIKDTDYISKFTLETILKYIDEVIAKRQKSGGRRILRWEMVLQGKEEVMRPVYA